VADKKRGRKPKGPTAKDAAQDIVRGPGLASTATYICKCRWEPLREFSPEEAKWAWGILAPVLGPLLRERPDAGADIKAITDEEIREAFYEAVLQAVRMPFMAAPKIEAAVREELGWTYRKEKEVLDRVSLTRAALGWFGLFELDAIEAQTRESGEPLSYGTTYRKDAYIKLAKRLRADGKKISAVALERRLQRLKKSWARTPQQEQRAREYEAHLKTFHVVERADGFCVERLDPEAGAPYGPFSRKRTAEYYMGVWADREFEALAGAKDATDAAAVRMSVRPEFPPDDLAAYEAYEARMELK
jgi:hypothetical protein